MIEPQDPIIPPHQNKIPDTLGELKNTAKRIAKKILNKDAYYEFGRYETVGNYVFTISEREIEKVALGLNYDLVAFKGTNDYYEEGVENVKMNAGTPLETKVKNEIARADERVKNGKAVAGLLTAIIFKTMPSADCMKRLKEDSFNIKILPKNPYI